MSKIGIVTVVTNENYNLEDFFTALTKQTYRDFTLYFVDNNSSDGSQPYFRELNIKNQIAVEYITLDHNSGFPAGSNIGAREAIKDGCQYLFILNNDVVIESACLQELINCIELEAGTVCSGLLLFRHQKYFPGIIQEFGGKIDYKNGRVLKNFENSGYKEVSLPEKIDTDFVGGGVCFIKANIFREAGMFEEMYFGYFDEIDLSYRLKKLNKYKITVTSKAIAYHNHHWTKKNKNSYYFEYYLSERNKFLFFRKYKLKLSTLTNILTDLIIFPYRLIWFVKVCDFTLGIYFLKGMFAGLLNHKGKPNFVE